MSYNGSGTFVINTAGQPVVSGTVISSTAFNALTADLATGLSTAITKDGQTTPTANIPMGNNKITGLAVGTAATDAANLSQVQSTTAKLINSISGTDTITGTMSPTLGAYATGQMFYFIAAGDNTGAVTLNIDSLGAKAVTRDGSVALAASDLKSGEVVVVVYDGTRFQVVSQLNSAGDARFANVSITSALNVGGVATFSAGTAAAPSITTTGDTNTGIFFPAADTIAFAEGGTEAMRLDSSGNLGLGTSSPLGKLNVGGAVADIAVQSGYFEGAKSSYAGNYNLWQNQLFVYDKTTGNAAGVGGAISFGADCGSSQKTWLASVEGVKENGTAGNYSGNLVFRTRTNGDATLYERMRLDSSGNLGLGVTPSAWGSNARALQMQYGGSLFTTNGGLAGVGNNVYSNPGTADYYIANGFATRYYQLNGTHVWNTAPSGSAGGTISFTQAMTLDSGGDLLVGATSGISSERLTLQNPGGNASFMLATDGTGQYYAGVLNDSTSFSGSRSNHAYRFYTNDTERARITSGGYFKASDNGGYTNSTGSYHEFDNTSTTNPALLVNSRTTSFADNVIAAGCFRTANTAYSIFKGFSGDGGTGGFSDVEFNLRGDGNGYADGTWNNNGADYAEYFESSTGGALTVGATVVLEGNKVREATASDPASAIMGVVRPKEPSKASMVVGNTAWNKWANKYLTDDFDRYIMEDHDVVEWTDEDGKQHSYESHNIPAGVTVPADAVRKTHDEKGNRFQHYKLNPAWDKDAEYTPREKRDEWIIVGLVGQVKVLKGKPVNDRWIKMRDVSAAVEEWMIR